MIEGRVEQVRDGVVEGWAWRPTEAAERVELRVMLDGLQVGTTPAHLPRPTLAAAGIGDGRHGFRFVLPAASAGPGRHSLRIEAEDDSLPPATGFVVETEDVDGEWRGVTFEVEHAGSPGETADGEAAPSIEGRVEQVSDGVVSGWAWRPAEPAERLQVRVVLDGDEVGTAIAELPRASLERAGIGDGAHAFRFSLPAASAHPGYRTLGVEADGQALPGASGFAVMTTRSDDPWYGARFSLAVAEPDGAASVNGPVTAASEGRADRGEQLEPPVAAPDGWLFERAVLQPPSAESALAGTEAEVASLLDALDQLDARVSQTGTKLLPVLCPMKEHVYRDQLPATVRSALAWRPGDLVARGLLAHPTLDALDLLATLQAGAEERPVFSPTSPWLSEWGSYCAYRALIKRIAMILPGVPPPVELPAANVLDVPPRRWNGPALLATEAGLKPCLPEELPDPPAEPIVVPPDGAAERTPREHLARLATALAVGWEQAQHNELGRSLFVGGSTHEGIAEWTGRHFRFTVLIGSDSPVIDLVSLERPDVIVYLVDERSLLL